MNSHSSFSLEGKKILVTGAAGHLGRVLCEHLVSDGAVVIAADLDHGRLKELQKEVDPRGQSISVFRADLANQDDRIQLASAVSKQHEHIDGAVFAAAFVGTSALEGWAVGFAKQDLTAWRAALELNLTAPFHLTQLFESLLRAGRNPSIVSIGSIYGSTAPDQSLYEGLEMGNPAGYGASKAGLSQLTRWLASELAPAIRVNTVSPGGIARFQPEAFVTRYVRRTPLGRMASEQDVVQPIAFLLSDAASYITGQELIVDGGRGIL